LKEVLKEEKSERMILKLLEQLMRISIVYMNFQWRILILLF